MGLDVRAYKNIVKVEDPRVSEIDDLCKVYHGFFPEQCGSLEDGAYYKGESKWFCRLSYGSYSHFRESLAEIGGWPKMKVEKPHHSDPDFLNKDFLFRFPHAASVWNSDSEDVKGNFVELIMFSDCEGFICSDVCKKLYKDFKAHEKEAENMFSDNSYFAKFYKGLMDAFAYASKNGFVQYT